jgi:hypothetical protein
MDCKLPAERPSWKQNVTYAVNPGLMAVGTKPRIAFFTQFNCENEIFLPEIEDLG